MRYQMMNGAKHDVTKTVLQFPRDAGCLSMSHLICDANAAQLSDEHTLFDGPAWPARRACKPNHLHVANRNNEPRKELLLALT